MSELEAAKIDFWREAVEAAASESIGFVASIAYTILLLRLLPQTEVGMYFFLLAIVYLLFQISKGVGKGVRKKVSATNNTIERSQYFWAGSLLLVPVLFCSSIVLYFLFFTFQSFIPITISNITIVAVIIAASTGSIMEMGRYHLSGAGFPGRAQSIRMVFVKFGFLLLTPLLLLFPSAEFVLALRSTTYLIAGIILIYLSPHQMAAPTFQQIRDVFIFSKWSVPTNLLNDFYHRWDTILLGIMVGTVSVSYYDGAMRLATIGYPFMVGISAAANIKLSGLFEEGENISDVFETVLVFSTIVAYPFLLLIAFNGRFLLSATYGAEYAPASLFLLLVGVQQVLQSFRIQFEELFNSIGTPEKTTKVSTIAVLFNIVTAPILVIKFGGIGVMYSTLFAGTIRLIAYEYQAYLEIGRIFINKPILIQPALIILFSVLLYAAFNSFVITQMLRIGISLGAIMLYYVLLYFISPEIQETTINAKNQIVKT